MTAVHTLVITQDPTTQVISTYPEGYKGPDKTQVMTAKTFFYSRFFFMVLGAVISLVSFIGIEAIADTNTGQTIRNEMLQPDFKQP